MMAEFSSAAWSRGFQYQKAEIKNHMNIMMSAFAEVEGQENINVVCGKVYRRRNSSLVC